LKTLLQIFSGNDQYKKVMVWHATIDSTLLVVWIKWHSLLGAGYAL